MPVLASPTQDWAARSSRTTTAADAVVPAWPAAPARTTTNRTSALKPQAATAPAILVAMPTHRLWLGYGRLISRPATIRDR